MRRCDKFGAPVQLNYAGQTTSGTLGGGLVSVCLKTLILAFFCMRLVALTGFQDPAISSHIVMEDRSKMQESINFGDYDQSIMIGFSRDNNIVPVALDPRIGTLNLFVAVVDYSLAKGLHTEYKNIPLQESKSRPGFYEPIDAQLLELKGSFFGSFAQSSSVVIKFVPCQVEDSTDCASKDDLNAFMKSHVFQMIGTTNFIEMDQVLSIEETLQKQSDLLIWTKIDLEQPQLIKYLELEEFRTELYDDSINFMGLSDPKTLDYLNFDKSSSQITVTAPQFTVWINLSSKVTKQKRVVYDIFMMFGEVGGLYDFLALALASIFGFASEHIMFASLVQKLFRIAETSDLALTSGALLNQFKPLCFPQTFVLAHAFSFGWCPRDQFRRRKAYEAGVNRLERQLDIVNIVRDNRSLKTLLELLLSKQERHMLSLQRKHSVLEQDPEAAAAISAFEESDDEIIMSSIKRQNFHFCHDQPDLESMTTSEKLQRGLILRDWSHQLPSTNLAQGITNDITIAEDSNNQI